MNIFKKDTEKHTNKLPMTGKVRKGFRIYCTAIMGAALILGTSVTAFAAGDPITVVNNLSSFIFGLIRAIGLYPAGLPIRGCPSDYLCQFPPRYRRCDLHGCHLLYRLLPDRHARMLHLRLCTRVGHHRNLDRLSDRAYPDRSHALREVLLETKN